MKRLKKIVLWLLCIAAFIYLAICVTMYFIQESLVFHPKKLEANFKFDHPGNYEELFINVSDDKKINGLLFKADSAKGLVFYLHGNAGALDTWGKAAESYLKNGYDFFILDYRGYGKSEGEIYSQEQFFADLQAAYDVLKTRYPEKNTVIIGYSIGSGPATMLASTNNPKKLILQAPYYSIIDMMHHHYPFVPDFLLKYKFKTYEFLEKVKAPVSIFHGDADEIIYYGSALKLKEHFKKGDTLFTLPGAPHNGMNKNEIYLKELKRILAED